MNSALRRREVAEVYDHFNPAKEFLRGAVVGTTLVAGAWIGRELLAQARRRVG